jgi:hypothetical protein
LLTQQSTITGYRLPTKENKLPFFRFRLQQAEKSLPFPFSICSTRKTEVAIFRLRWWVLLLMVDVHVHEHENRHGHGHEEVHNMEYTWI